MFVNWNCIMLMPMMNLKDTCPYYGPLMYCLFGDVIETHTNFVPPKFSQSLQASACRRILRRSKLKMFISHHSRIHEQSHILFLRKQTTLCTTQCDFSAGTRVNCRKLLQPLQGKDKFGAFICQHDHSSDEGLKTSFFVD